MKPALAFRQPYYPKSWQDLPNGELVLSEINQLLAPWWQKFFGYHLLKIGDLSNEISTKKSLIKHQVRLSTLKQGTTEYCSSETKPSLVGDIDDLPFLEHSVDVCLLSHALEFSLDPHHVVREASRVLIPNGYLIITGFNPFSLAGLNRFIPFRSKQRPWNEHFFSPMRVKDWLHLMGYEILADHRCLHSTLIGNVASNSATRYLQSFANDYLPCLASVYVIVAKKRILPLTPIKPKWQVRSRFQPVEVSTMQIPSSKRIKK